MMMEQEFENLLNAVSESFGVKKSEILRKYSESGLKARSFMCHAIYHGLTHLRRPLLEKTSISRFAFYKDVDLADKAIYESNEDLCVMNEIRVKVGLPRLKRAVSHKARISNTKNLFGFDYTELDELRFRNACRGAMEYMRKLCSIGRNPIPDGMVYSPIRPKPTYNSWYND